MLEVAALAPRPPCPVTALCSRVALNRPSSICCILLLLFASSSSPSFLPQQSACSALLRSGADNAFRRCLVRFIHSHQTLTCTPAAPISAGVGVSRTDSFFFRPIQHDPAETNKSLFVSAGDGDKLVNKKPLSSGQAENAVPLTPKSFFFCSHLIPHVPLKLPLYQCNFSFFFF